MARPTHLSTHKQAPTYVFFETQTLVQKHTYSHTHTYTHMCNLDVARGNLCGVLLELCGMHYLAWPQRANVSRKHACADIGKF